MDRLCCDCLVVGPIQTNCYLVYHEDSRECLVVDPGFEATRIVEYMKKKEYQPVAILLTHGHFDHITAADEVRQACQIPVYAAKEEEKILGDARLNASVQFGHSVSVQADHYLEDEQEVSFLGQTMRCIHTPGHTSGGMCYYFPKAGFLMSGDTLFQESVGRTDFPTGSMSALIRSVREKLFILPNYIKVYPGHGMITTIQDEKMFNPYAVE